MLVYSARRTVADCPCGRKYRFSEQQTHRATCLPYQSEARRRAEREAISQKLRRSRRHTAELRATSRSVRLGGAQEAVELVSESLIPHLVALALFALLIQPLRRDGTLCPEAEQSLLCSDQRLRGHAFRGIRSYSYHRNHAVL